MLRLLDHNYNSDDYTFLLQFTDVLGVCSEFGPGCESCHHKAACEDLERLRKYIVDRVHRRYSGK